MSTWNIGRKSPRYTPAACRHCGKVCASAQGRLAHERRCPQAATPPVEEVAVPKPLPRTASQALAALARGETAPPYHCPRCGGTTQSESLKRPGMCKACSKQRDQPIVPVTPEERAVAARIKPPPAPRVRKERPTPARDAATERARQLLGAAAGDGDPLEAWLIAHQNLSAHEQARRLGVSDKALGRWRRDLQVAGKLTPPAPRQPATDLRTCPGCGGTKEPKSQTCQSCRRQAQQQQQRQSYATAQVAKPARARSHLPGGPPLSIESEQAEALWQAARARGDEAETALRARAYLVARARDWGLVATKKISNARAS